MRPLDSPPCMGRRGPGCRIVEPYVSSPRSVGAALPQSYYEIRVVGVLPPEALLDFERLNASVEPVETLRRCELDLAGHRSAAGRRAGAAGGVGDR
jgi:hypothetical protein